MGAWAGSRSGAWRGYARLHGGAGHECMVGACMVHGRAAHKCMARVRRTVAFPSLLPPPSPR
eukprot:364743-Chlamydomonas_euryale.AAC.22